MTSENNLIDTQIQGGIIALRGFRKQFLHSLNRIITSSCDIFYPEGIEDLDVYDSENHLTELIQVKDYKDSLVTSNLKTFFFGQLKFRQTLPMSFLLLQAMANLEQNSKQS